MAASGMPGRSAESAAGHGAGLVLITLGSGQFLMTLDSSVMNVAIATVAKDVGTTVTGIQTAITLYTLVMAMLMIPGGKVGSLIGQNTATNLGASIGTALAGSLLIAALTTSFLNGIKENPAVPPAVSTQATTELAGGIPFLSDADLQKALTKAGASEQVTQAVLDENQQARLDGLRTALAALALLSLIALFFSTRIPARQPGSDETRRPRKRPRSLTSLRQTTMS